jgi:putative ABC transport system permease protein
LSTDVADHLREYATFKAMGYGPGFFLGVVFEEALVLGVLGFVPGLIVGTSDPDADGVKITTLPLAHDAVDGGQRCFWARWCFRRCPGPLPPAGLAAADPADLF